MQRHRLRSSLGLTRLKPVRCGFHGGITASFPADPPAPSLLSTRSATVVGTLTSCMPYKWASVSNGARGKRRRASEWRTSPQSSPLSSSSVSPARGWARDALRLLTRTAATPAGARRLLRGTAESDSQRRRVPVDNSSRTSSVRGNSMKSCIVRTLKYLTRDRGSPVCPRLSPCGPAPPPRRSG